MRFPPLARFAVGVALVVTGCADAATPEGPAAPPTAEIAPSTTEPEAVTTAVGLGTDEAGEASTREAAVPRPTPVAFRSFVAALDGPGPALTALAAEATDAQLTDLAELVCATVEPDMSTAELGATALGSGADLAAVAPDLRPEEITLVFGALAGLHCPEQLPLSGVRLGHDDVEPPADLVEGFRATVAELWPPTHPLPAYAAATADARLRAQSAAACDLASAEHTTVQFGLAVAQHRAQVLTQDEAAALGADGHQELFGALVGWFCPDRLPDPG